MDLLSLTFDRLELGHLGQVRRALSQSATEAGADERSVRELVTAADEALSNVIVHGYKGQPGPVSLWLQQEAGDLFLRIQDGAPAYDPTLAPAPDVTLPLEQRSAGGLGVHMIREFADEVRYRRLHASGNELVLIKRNVLSQNTLPGQS